MLKNQLMRVITYFIFCYAVTAFPSGVAAYVENTINWLSTTPADSGCLYFASGLDHGDHHASMTIRADLTFFGVTHNGMQCNSDLPSNAITGIGGQTSSYLIKLIEAGPTMDTFEVCHGVTSPMQSAEKTLQFRYTYQTPPCGEGWYAVVICLHNVEVAYVWPWTYGTFESTDPTTCNTSSNWHPVGIAPPASSGGNVRIW